MVLKEKEEEEEEEERERERERESPCLPSDMDSLLLM